MYFCSKKGGTEKCNSILLKVTKTNTQACRLGFFVCSWFLGEWGVLVFLFVCGFSLFVGFLCQLSTVLLFLAPFS